MPSISTTAGTLGFAAAVTNIYVWHVHGQPLPITTDVQASFGVVFGVLTHAVGLAWNYILPLFKGFLEKKLGISSNPISLSQSSSTGGVSQ
jgi:hypothetical protein